MSLILMPSLPIAVTMIDRGGLWMLAGFLLLGWVMARMSLRRRKARIRQRGEEHEVRRRLGSDRPKALPLSDAPRETQRWQVAMFDLQRELTGELDSRIAITQNLIRQLDQRIAKIESLQQSQRD